VNTTSDVNTPRTIIVAHSRRLCPIRKGRGGAHKWEVGEGGRGGKNWCNIRHKQKDERGPEKREYKEQPKNERAASRSNLESHQFRGAISSFSNEVKQRTQVHCKHGPAWDNPGGARSRNWIQLRSHKKRHDTSTHLMGISATFPSRMRAVRNTSEKEKRYTNRDFVCTSR
jgi:hypothetical protein